jgi:hypothetical protein
MRLGFSNEIDKHHNYPVCHTPWAHIVHMGCGRWLLAVCGRAAVQTTYLLTYIWTQ